MRLWRLTRAGHTALDGAGTVKHGGRYSPPGAPVVNFASEAGLAVLVALRYLPSDPAEAPEDYVLGWTEIDAVPERMPEANEDMIRAFVTRWLDERRRCSPRCARGCCPGGCRDDEHAAFRCAIRAAAHDASVQLRRVPPHPADARALSERPVTVAVL